MAEKNRDMDGDNEKINASVPDIDVLVVDIDNTFVRHQTVGMAARLVMLNAYRCFGKRYEDEKLYPTSRMLGRFFPFFFSNIFLFWKIRPKYLLRLFRIAFFGIILYMFNAYRQISNRFRRVDLLVSNEMLVKIWSRNVLGMDLASDDYEVGRQAYISSVKRNVLDYFEKLKEKNPDMIKIGISQSFSIGTPMMKEILGLDHYISNQFFCNSGKITSASLNVVGGEDKLNFARRIIGDALLSGKIPRGYKVGLILDCYDDVQLIRLDNVSLVLYKKKIRRFVEDSIVGLKVLYR